MSVPDRPACSPDGTTNITLGLKGNWFFKRRHVVFLNAGYQWLGSEIEDSPIVTGNTGAQLILGGVYTFLMQPHDSPVASTGARGVTAWLKKCRGWQAVEERH